MTIFGVWGDVVYDSRLLRSISVGFTTTASHYISILITISPRNTLISTHHALTTRTIN